MKGGTKNKVNKADRRFNSFLSVYMPVNQSQALLHKRILAGWADGFKERAFSRIDRMKRKSVADTRPQDGKDAD